MYISAFKSCLSHSWVENMKISLEFILFSVSHVYFGDCITDLIY